MTRVLVPLTMVALSVLCACKMGHQAGSGALEFKQLPPSSGSKIDEAVQLTHAAGITYQGQVWDGLMVLGFMERMHDVRFPSLTRAQFDSVKSAYGYGVSQIRYLDGTTYWLSDFLTPMMQATLGHSFTLEMQDAPENSYKTMLGANCWGAAYEALRTGTTGATSFFVFLAPPTDALVTAISGAGRGMKLTEASTLSDLEQFSDIRFGDMVLLFDSKHTLQHAALVVDRGYYYEKEGHQGIYHLTTSADWAYVRTVSMCPDCFQLWRTQPGVTPLPSQAFQSYIRFENKGKIEQSAGPLLQVEVKWDYDPQTGRALLPARFYLPLVSVNR